MNQNLKNIHSLLFRSAFSLCLAGTSIILSCNQTTIEDEVDFDRSAMLSSLADGLIIPNFESLQQQVDGLNTAVINFNQDKSVQNLSLIRSAWELAVLDYQHCSAFGFGPADLPLGPFSTVLGVFPADETQIEANILNADFNLAASFERDIRGLYAIEYLIYGNEVTDEEIVAGFDEVRSTYLSLITAELKTTIDQIVSTWKTSYKSQFVSNDGTSAGSSISLLYNAFVKDYENLKNFKVELPAGLTAGQSSSDPKLVEAYYSGISKDLIIAHFESSRNIWTGRSRSGSDLISFEEYLMEVVEGPNLVTKTKTDLSSIETAINAVPAGRLSDHLETSEIVILRDLLQSNTANFKSSLSSLLGISITFNSGDGD